MRLDFLVFCDQFLIPLQSQFPCLISVLTLSVLVTSSYDTAVGSGHFAALEHEHVLIEIYLYSEFYNTTNASVLSTMAQCKFRCWISLYVKCSVLRRCL